MEEFFQLFKTPWEPWQEGKSYEVLLTTTEPPAETDARLVLVFGAASKFCDAALGIETAAIFEGVTLQLGTDRWPVYGRTAIFKDPSRAVVCATTQNQPVAVERDGLAKTIRIGYDLFDEIAFLIRNGQPVAQAQYPTIDLHASFVRQIILNSGLPLIEIPPSPAGVEFSVCLTHDIDFVGIRRHKFDHTMWGFLYRSTAGAFRDFVRGKIPAARLLACWKAAATLPFIHLGLAKDFWMPFEWYLDVERGLSPTYFFIPFKGRAGEKVTAPHAQRRASAYDITDIPEWISRLRAEGCEIGTHGLDAWHSVESAKEELDRTAAASNEPCAGIRMHWLLQNEKTPAILEAAGFSYDSTCGYNEAPGYRNGTTQVFRPEGAQRLMELPMHIQDGALFYPKRLGLSESEAWDRCLAFIENARRFGGVLTLLWHDRSHGPERFWGDFYARLVRHLAGQKTCFNTAAQTVEWFRQRRDISFSRVTSESGAARVRVRGPHHRAARPFTLRIHSTRKECRHVSEVIWDGQGETEVEIPGVPAAAEMPASQVAATR